MLMFHVYKDFLCIKSGAFLMLNNLYKRIEISFMLGGISNLVYLANFVYQLFFLKVRLIRFKKIIGIYFDKSLNVNIKMMFLKIRL